MWLFAILIVLALGGIAVVAAGRGAPLADVYDDRPDSGVPAEGPLVAEDLRRVRFPLAFRGYRMSDVDALLDRLADQLADPSADEPEDRVDEVNAARPLDEPSTPSAGRGDEPTA